MPGTVKDRAQNTATIGDHYYIKGKMIFRIWHGWTTLENADTYENLFKTEIFPEIVSKNVSGYRGC